MEYNFIEELQKKVQANPPSIVFPESEEEKILQVVRMVKDRNIAIPVLLGNKEEICAHAAQMGISLEGIEFVNPADPGRLERYARLFREMNPEFSEKMIGRMLRSPLNFAAMMVKFDDADTFIAGLAHTTGDVVLASQTIIGMMEGIKTVSSIGILSVPGFKGPQGNLMVIGDCAVCPNPDANELADIAIASADTVKNLLEWEPRVAMLSFSTKGSGEHEIVQKVIDSVGIARQRCPVLKIDGEFQLDSAIVPEVADRKVKMESEVAGKANILIFPDLNAGNIGVKLVQRFAGCSAYGPLLQGFAKPVSDMSRGAPLDEMLGGITMLAVRAMKNK